MEAALGAALGTALGAPTPEAKTEETPAAERNKDGKFKKAEDKTQAKETDPVEAEAEADDEGEFDPFAEEGAEPEPKPHQLDKATQAIQQDLGVTKRELASLKGVIEELRNELKTARSKPEAPAEDHAAELRKMAAEGYIDDSVADRLIKMFGSVKQEPARDDSAIIAEVNQLRAERAWDKSYPELAGQYERACTIAWEAAKKRFPSLDPSSPTVIAYGQGKLQDIAESAVKRIADRKKKPVADPGIEPQPSTKGARPATAGVARAPKASTKEPTEEELYKDFEKELAAGVGGF